MFCCHTDTANTRIQHQYVFYFSCSICWYSMKTKRIPCNMKYISHAALPFIISDYPWTECLTEEEEFLAVGVVEVKVQSCFAVPYPRLSWKKCMRNICNYPATFSQVYAFFKEKEHTHGEDIRRRGTMKLWFWIHKNLSIYGNSIATQAICNNIQHNRHHLLCTINS